MSAKPTQEGFQPPAQSAEYWLGQLRSVVDLERRRRLTAIQAVRELRKIFKQMDRNRS